jgi:hypothetical protein
MTQDTEGYIYKAQPRERAVTREQAVRKQHTNQAER